MTASTKEPTVRSWHDIESDFVRAYVAAALWSSNDESRPDGGDPLDDNYDIEDFAPETLLEMEEDCRRFCEENGSLLAQYVSDQYTPADLGGHDFWLTRNRHGSGYWDRTDWLPRKSVRDRLTAASHRCGEYHLYVGDDGKIYGSKG